MVSCWAYFHQEQLPNYPLVSHVNGVFTVRASLSHTCPPQPTLHVPMTDGGEVGIVICIEEFLLRRAPQSYLLAIVSVDLLGRAALKVCMSTDAQVY